jgi:3-oxoadipate enol-lactonase
MIAILAHSVNGFANDQPVVLLQDLTTSSDLWSPQLAAWASQFRVVRIDLPRHWKCAPPPGITRMANYARAVRDVLDHLVVNRAALVGLSSFLRSALAA